MSVEEAIREGLNEVAHSYEVPDEVIRPMVDDMVRAITGREQPQLSEAVTSLLEMEAIRGLKGELWNLGMRIQHYGQRDRGLRTVMEYVPGKVKEWRETLDHIERVAFLISVGDVLNAIELLDDKTPF